MLNIFGRAISQSGNVLITIYAAVATVAVLGVVGSNVIKGPVRGMHNVTQNKIVQNDMIAAGALLSEHSLKDPTADCDADTMIEPVAYKIAGAGIPHPAGGGLLPDAVGANKNDPWKSAYGYCAWDHGTARKVAGCGGASANRLAGGNITTATTITVISAGPDRTFQTSCVDYVAEGMPVVSKPEGSDDVVKEIAYRDFLLPRMAQAAIGELPDEACTAQAIGTMRIELGVVQICMDTGWEEVGTSAKADGDFISVENAALGNTYTSNAISFSGFLNTKTINVEGAAMVLINGVVTPMPAQIAADDSVQLRAVASMTPEEVRTFAISISGVKKTWAITSRNRTAANLLISPSPIPGFIIDGVSGEAYSSTTEFMLTNIGEEDAVVSAPSLTNGTNYEVTSNNCASTTLEKNESCSVFVRARASATGVYTGDLNFYAVGTFYAGSHTPSASLTVDSLFPVMLSNATNVNISSIPEFTANGRWASSRPKNVIVPAGVVIGSNSASIPAMRSGTSRGGTLTITVNGEIQGAGGQPNSGAGGTAFQADQSGVAIINNGAIRAGGGAGGIGGTGGTGVYYPATTVTEGPFYRMQVSDNYYMWIAGPDPYISCDPCNYNVVTVYWNARGGGGAYAGGHYLFRHQVSNSGTTSFAHSDGWTYHRGSHASGNSYYVYATRTSYDQPSYSSGGGGGNGGRGRGYDGANASGAGGTVGGTNAGAGGAGGTGGGWGVAGASGINGVAGNNGGGTSGSAGGAAGIAIQNNGNVTRTGAGVMQGQIL